MDVSKTQATMSSVKQLQHEVSAWEMRLEGLRTDCATLTRQKEALQKEAEGIRSVLEQDAARHVLEKRQATAKLEETQRKLGEDRTALDAAAIELRKERNVLDREKTEAENMKNNAAVTEARLGQFITLIRREAEKL